MTADGSMLCTRTGKIMYDSPKAAKLASIQFKRRKLRSANRSGFGHNEPALHTYHCQHCGAYHNGHATGTQRTGLQKARLSRSWRNGGKRR